MAQRRPAASYFRRQSLTVPPDSLSAWMRLAVWEFWMGVFLCGSIAFGSQLVVTAPEKIVTVFDLTKCYAAPVVQPCERVAYRAGGLNALLNFWCGLLLLTVAAWLLWELWSVAAPRPITDEFLKLLDDSFGRDWRRPRTWPWARVGWAYGFTTVGVAFAFVAGLLVSSALSSSGIVRAPAVRVETSEHFRSISP